jgi:methylphosphotriester-DNA--protein-cysteine methyltransferase
MPRLYKLTAPDGSQYESEQPGQLGGNRKDRIYGRLDCGTARAALRNGYAEYRVFFADEAAAIAAGYRPCGNCMRQRYREWKGTRKV